MFYLRETFINPIGCIRLQLRSLKRNNGNQATHGPSNADAAEAQVNCKKGKATMICIGEKQVDVMILGINFQRR